MSHTIWLLNISSNRAHRKVYILPVCNMTTSRDVMSLTPCLKTFEAHSYQSTYPKSGGLYRTKWVIDSPYFFLPEYNGLVQESRYTYGINNQYHTCMVMPYTYSLTVCVYVYGMKYTRGTEHCHLYYVQ